MLGVLQGPKLSAGGNFGGFVPAVRPRRVKNGLKNKKKPELAWGEIGAFHSSAPIVTKFCVGTTSVAKRTVAEFGDDRCRIVESPNLRPC